LPATAVDLDDVVLDEVARLRQHGHVAIDTSAVSAAAVTGSREDLARVARNLLDNAERHASSRITVSLSSNGDGVVLEVSDDGPGVPADDRERVFERFTRLDDTRARTTGGTGLGLAITREIVTAHGGTIVVGDGATFVVRLPPG
jgi:signal transduction histidine kinase